MEYFCTVQSQYALSHFSCNFVLKKRKFIHMHTQPDPFFVLNNDCFIRPSYGSYSSNGSIFKKICTRLCWFSTSVCREIGERLSAKATMIDLFTMKIDEIDKKTEAIILMMKIMSAHCILIILKTCLPEIIFSLFYYHSHKITKKNHAPNVCIISKNL